MSATIKRYADDLIIKLAANESLILKSRAGRTYLNITMSADSSSVVVHTVPVTQWAAGTDIGNTGWTP